MPASLSNIRLVGRFYDKNGVGVGDSLQASLTNTAGHGVDTTLGGPTHKWGLSAAQLTPAWINTQLRPGARALETGSADEQVSFYHVGVKVYYTANGVTRTKSTRLGRGGHRILP